MKPKQLLYYTTIVAVLAWCIIGFGADIAQITFAPVWACWDAILLAGAFSLLNYLLRIVRWSVYMKRFGHPLAFGFSALTYIAGFAFTLSPGKVGEMVRGRYLHKAGVPLSNTAAAFFVERLMDLLAMIALACLAVGASQYGSMIWGAVAVISAIMAMLVLAPWQKLASRAHDWAWLPQSLNRIAQSILRTLIAARALLHPNLLVGGFVIGLIAWGCEGVGLMVIGQIAPGVVMETATAVGIYSVAVIVGALSFLPGGLGSTEAVMVALLHTHGYPMSDALLLTLICRLLTLWLAVVLGWLAVLILRPKSSGDIYTAMESSQLPLCVDLDGTLIHSDLLLETVLLLIKRNPLYLCLLPFWLLLKGKAGLKAEIAGRIELNPAALPYNQPFIEWLKSQKALGRQLWLCTASNHSLADAVARHLGIFSGVFASSEHVNLSGRNKAKQLVEKFGEKAFDYCGNHRVDLAIWRVSQAAIVVNGSERLRHQVGAVSSVVAVFPKQTGLIRPILKALRLHQWAKNVLVFVPLATAHKLGDLAIVEQALLAFLAFGFCASSVYLLNDMLDLEADRQHSRKHKRPFASGKLSLLAGFALVPLLLLATVMTAALLSPMFWLVLAIYYGLTAAYSFGAKRIVLIDTIALAGLYTIRIVAGAAAISVSLSFWLLLFSVFLFLSLALVKRYAELDAMQREGKLKAAGRGYHIEDLPILHSLGTASGYLCVLVLALYINSPAVEMLYRHPQVIWFLCVLLLYWISRVWLKAHRGKMHDDPVIFALKDRASLAVGLLAAITVFLAV